MILHEPFLITPRLEAGVKIGETFLSLTYSDRAGQESRVRYRWTVDIAGTEYTDDDLQSGNMRGQGLQSGFASLLSFLSAAAESYPDGDNADLFPAPVVEWAHQYSDEISMLQCEVEEAADGSLIKE